MIIRKYRPEDRKAVIELYRAHAKNLRIHDPEDPSVIETMVVEQDGKIVAALSGKAVLEAHLMVSKDISPIKRWALLRKLFNKGLRRAYEIGYVTVSCPVPEEVENHEKYAELLTKMEGFAIDPRRFVTGDVVKVVGPKLSSPELWAKVLG